MKELTFKQIDELLCSFYVEDKELGRKINLELIDVGQNLQNESDLLDGYKYYKNFIKEDIGEVFYYCIRGDLELNLNELTNILKKYNVENIPEFKYDVLKLIHENTFSF
jgi:hypothetical protein